ncbi:MAG: hypothetical protein IJC56_10690 [Clostridia bacterium]|nr:hypothetical protein [Clostridia bacterium]
MKDKLMTAGKAVLKVFSRNIGLKLLSVLFALMLWSYVISSNTDITRTKTHSGLQGYVTGQVTLEVYDLAMVSDPTSALSNVSVDVEVPQVNYAASTADNVQVMLDVSSVRTAGTQEVPIKATSTYGKVTRVYPSSLTLTFEPLDSRSIPVNVRMTGTDEDYWYNCARVNPSQVTVSGATSIVQDISSVVVNADVTGRLDSYSTSCSIELLDRDGNVIPNALVNRSASSVSISMEVYPTKELEVSTATDDVLVGQAAEGYIIEAITVQPRTITVAAEQELLDSLDRLIIDPIEIDSPSQSFTRRASISGLTDFRYISSEQVYVNVQIAEETISDWIEDVDITFIGLADGLEITEGRGKVAVHVTGPRSRIEAMSADNLSVIVDLAGLGAGSYELPVEPDTANHPTVVFEVDPANIQVTLDAVAEE